MKYKALLLAAGMGSRLRPITDKIPKCLVKVGNEPMLKRWINDIRETACTEVLINTHYLSSKVREYLESEIIEGVNIEITEENVLLGTAGTLINNQKYFGDSGIIFIHADNATDRVLNKMMKRHINRPKNCIMTMLTFETNMPEKCGIVEIDEEGVVVNFHEKISNPPGNLANGAVYIIEPEFFEIIKAYDKEVFDFSLDVIPNLLGKICTWKTSDPYIDIGTPNQLDKALKIWPNTTHESTVKLNP